MKRTFVSLLIALLLGPVQANACKVLLTDSIQLPLNSTEISNSARLSLVRHYLTAREWTQEGAMATIDALAYEWEHKPAQLARQRGEQMKSFLVGLGMAPDDVYVQERIFARKDGEFDADSAKQIWVQFVPKCPPAGCQQLCNTPGLEGVASYAITPATPGPPPGADRLTCGDDPAPARTRVVTATRWTERTNDNPLTLLDDQKRPLARTCYRISTSAARYSGMTDERGRTGPVQLLGPEFTKIEIRIERPDRPTP
ncbi:hypothetical protein BLA18112_04363 [Burkholderia lata]|uniref:Lipoprotein n=1 Tax=Burkholderia lata (strain ATCC 17760 / DSM 23089 / LMG 22485 / NCIMB 9086 / R18194 / 383) TaxID=482957 RepID=A0A6P2XB43_BURL3|nr:hypothetical protein [Burkholderia lata]VWD06554.1 hypothetical protein BLA18112_04363 [Burkholderia lata]